ncbi:long-chain-fatty-acid--CoA ligase [Sphingobium sp.]|uniref:long-chain-fatty-acid--CoA ligase n=1 Tax=Sphingobium sp. TaxID=1912891 RepID=UPI0028BDEC0D|nr:long-chain-fatty-acid--CoA ligase [Sphingobium sp.]
MPLRFAERASEAYHPPLIIRHLLETALITSAEQEIIYRDRHRYSYREFAGRIGRLASLLEQCGARQGMTIAMLDWDSHRYLEAYFAIPMMGAVLQTANVRMPVPQLAYTLQHAKAEILVVHRDFFPMIEEILPSLIGVKAVIAIMDGAEEALPSYACGEYELLSALASPDYPFQDFDENAVATTFYTTGTTGTPKGVCFTHRQIVLHTLATTGPFGGSDWTDGFGFGDVYMPMTPMFHVHAWGVPYMATLLGVKQVYPGRYEPEILCAMRDAHGVTYSHCVPTILQMIFQAADASGIDLGGWKITVGGSAMSKTLCAEARRRGMKVHAGYGMSETAPTICITHARLDEQGDEEKLLETLTATGVPVPMVQARIVDEAMNPMPHDGMTRGELVLRAPWLTPCYTGDAAASEALWRGGWLHTQDVATIDERGYIRIRDRLKDVIKTGGEWIDSIQLEDLLGQAQGVAEAAVIAVPDAKWGERPLAVIVPEPEALPTLEVLNVPVAAAIAAGAITRYARLERFELVDRLPRTSVGKIDKKLLRERYAEPCEVAAQPRDLSHGKK